MKIKISNDMDRFGELKAIDKYFIQLIKNKSVVLSTSGFASRYCVYRIIDKLTSNTFSYVCKCTDYEDGSTDFSIEILDEKENN